MSKQIRGQFSIGQVVSHFFAGYRMRFIYDNNIVSIQNIVERTSGWWQIVVSTQNNSFQVELHEIEIVFAEING